MIDQIDKLFCKDIEHAILDGKIIKATRENDVFDISARHVLVLLEDSFSMFQRRSYGTCVFLAITALEEIVKAEVAVFKSPQNSKQGKKCRDPLKNHALKHRIAVRPTTMMGRLPKILGEKVCKRLRLEAFSGDFKTLRETALYTQMNQDGLKTPVSEITRRRARELLLLAVECADDILVGMTSYSFEQSVRFDELFEELACIKCDGYS